MSCMLELRCKLDFACISLLTCRDKQNSLQMCVTNNSMICFFDSLFVFWKECFKLCKLDLLYGEYLIKRMFAISKRKRSPLNKCDHKVMEAKINLFVRNIILFYFNNFKIFSVHLEYIKYIEYIEYNKTVILKDYPYYLNNLLSIIQQPAYNNKSI